MQYKEIIKLTTDFFIKKNIPNAKLEAELLLCYTENISREKLIIKNNEEVPIDIVDRYREIIKLRAKNYPFNYITGKKEFYGLDFFVNENVLIPRPDTEKIIDLIRKNFDEKKEYELLDICTGSGIIPITFLKFFKNSCSDCIDFKDSVLSVAYQNSEYHKVLDRINFFNIDVLNNSDIKEKLLKKYDIITCNPPYVHISKKTQLQKELLYEPSSALFVDDNLLYYKKILSFIFNLVKNKYKILFEISNEFSETLINYLKQNYQNIKYEIFKDYANNDRVLMIENLIKT